MTSRTVNPHAHLLLQMRALLQTESRMPPDARRAFSWILRADYCDTHCTIIKGGANTIIMQFGDDRRDPCYPEDALRLLNELRAQPYPLYVVVRGSVRRAYHCLREAKSVAPREGMRIGAVALDGTRCITHDARSNTVGNMAWVVRK